MHPLDAIEVRTPCTASWEAMVGDDRVRFCGACRKHVFDLSAMTRAEAESFLETRERACVRFFRRADGTVVTADCTRRIAPIGRLAMAGAALVALGLGGAAIVESGPAFPQHLEEARERARHAIRGTVVESALVSLGVLTPAPVGFVGGI